MILIEERETHKLPGITSFFVSFNYNKDIIDKIKMLPSYNYDTKTKEWEIPITSLSNLLDMVALIDDVDISLLSDKSDSIKDYDHKGQFKTHPFDYQMDGIEFGMQHDRWLLLDVPGLGKSLQAIYIAQELKRTRGLSHCLVICGVNTLKTNWKKEIQKHSNLSCRILGEKTSKRGNVSIGSISERLQQLKEPIDEFFVITNIETLRDDAITKELLNTKNNNFDMIVLDEAHCCKDPTSKQGHNLLKLNKANYRLAMTGTLLLNNPLDAYVPLKWIGADRATYTNFKYYYCIYGGLFSHDLIGFQNMKVLKDQLDKFSLRRTKELLDLPPKTVINEYVDMNSTQSSFYKDIVNGVVDSVDKVELNPTCVLSMVARLRQATSMPMMLTSENIQSSKMDRAVDLVEQVCSDGKSKVVVFSTFKEPAYKLGEMLNKFNPLICTGDEKDIDIQKRIDAFQEDDIHKVLVCTWQKMGTGVTLNRASTAIFLDTPWTYGMYCQAQDRVHRIGSKENVTIYNLICNYSIDERVLEIVNNKEMISDYVVDDKLPANVVDKLKEIILDLK